MTSSSNARTRWSFGLSGLADNVVGTAIGVHLFVFYTDVAGLAPLWVSAGLAVALGWDAIASLGMGRLSDRTRWRAGRRRPYVLIGAIPVALAFAALMSPPEGLEGGALAAWLTASLLVLFTARTVVQVPVLSLLPELARDAEGRTRFAAAREQLGNVGDLLGLLLPIALLMIAGAADEGADPSIARGAFRLAGGLVAIVALGALLFTWAGTREDRDVPPPREIPLRDVFAALRANAPFRALLGASALAAVALAFVNAMVLYVLEHVMQAHDPAVHLGAFVINALAAIASYPLWTRVVLRYGKPTAFRLGLGLSALAFSSVFVVGPGDYLGLVMVMVFSGAANVGFWMQLAALTADVTDLDAARHGERREGLFAGFATFTRKLAVAGAAAGVGLGLTLIGYEESVAPSAEVVWGLKLLFAVPTTLLVLAALWVFRTYEGRAPARVSVLPAVDPS
ncbi:MAG: MFS transporter [Sandaracinaceae bacterium]|nr:MFS transporter [Sandaracinaceae bacterium]